MQKSTWQRKTFLERWSAAKLWDDGAKHRVKICVIETKAICRLQQRQEGNQTQVRTSPMERIEIIPSVLMWYNLKSTIFENLQYYNLTGRTILSLWQDSCFTDNLSILSLVTSLQYCILLLLYFSTGSKILITSPCCFLIHLWQRRPATVQCWPFC